jgi:two-component system CheB/CheR fusion protein
MIVFSDAPAERGAAKSRGRSPRRAQVVNADAVNQAQLEVRAMREEMRISQEQVQSSNEELQSTNEELQSANEELMTSKEEMQSMNEELHTVNAELRSKLESLATANNDLKNLLNSTDIAILFLDNALRIRRFTDQTARIIKLIPSDVGRPLGDVVSSLVYPEIEHDIRKTLRTLEYSEKEIPTTDGRWFQVRIMPYRTLDNVVDGGVITFSDVSVAKALETELRCQRPAGAA